MSNPLINNSNNNIGNILGMYQNFIKNPMQAILSAGLNVPTELMGNPQQIIQHLLNSNQISQSQVNQAQQMLSQMNNNPHT